MSNYTMSPVVNGEKKQMIVKVGDTTPIGGIMDYEGSVVPDGWEEVDGYTNYFSQITNVTSGLSFNNNIQQLTKNSDGLVTINLTMTASANIDATNFIDLFVIPNEVLPSKNAMLVINCFSQNANGTAYIQQVSNKIRGKVGTTISNGSEIAIIGSYYV